MRLSTLIILIVSVNCAQADELPLIDLPEYIVSGVERAMLPQGRKIAISAKSVVRVTGRFESARPELLSGPVWNPPAKPETLAQPMRGRIEASVGMGGFGYSSTSTGLVMPETHYPFDLEMEFNRRPRRVTAGRLWDTELSLRGFGEIGDVISYSPLIEFDVSAFQVTEPGETAKRIRRDIMAGILISSISAGYGEFGGRALIRKWSQRNGNQISGYHDLVSLQHRFVVKNGVLESDFQFDAEPVDGTITDLDLFTATLKYSSLFSANLLYWIGAHAYTGNSTSAGDRQGAQPSLGVSYRLTKADNITISYVPKATMRPLVSLLDRYPMLADSSEGLISEDIVNLAFEYRRLLMEQSQASVRFERLRQRHHPFIWYGELNGTAVEPATLNMSRVTAQWNYTFGQAGNVSLSATYIDAGSTRSPSGLHIGLIGDRAPQVSKWTAKSVGKLNVLEWSTMNSLRWQSEAPLDFAGSIKRPDRFIWDLTFKRSLGREFDVIVGVDNLLNVSYYDIPGYDESPLTVYTRLEFSR